MIANANYAAAQTDTELVAAPPADMQIVIRSFAFSSDGSAAGSAALVEKTASSTTKLGPYYFPATAGSFGLRFEEPLRLTAGENLGLTSTGATNLSVTVEWSTERNKG